MANDFDSHQRFVALDLSWQSRGVCNGIKGLDMFPEDDDLEQIAYLKRTCRRCPVQEQCLEYALRMNISDGVWGGRIARERKMLRALRGWKVMHVDRPIRHGTEYGYKHQECRCPPCRAAHVLCVTEYKERRRERNVESSLPVEPAVS